MPPARFSGLSAFPAWNIITGWLPPSLDYAILGGHIGFAISLDVTGMMRNHALRRQLMSPDGRAREPHGASRRVCMDMREMRLPLAAKIPFADMHEPLAVTYVPINSSLFTAHLVNDALVAIRRAAVGVG